MEKVQKMYTFYIKINDSMLIERSRTPRIEGVVLKQLSDKKWLKYTFETWCQKCTFYQCNCESKDLVIVRKVSSSMFTIPL